MIEGATGGLSASAAVTHGQQAARGTPCLYVSGITEFVCQKPLEEESESAMG